MSHILLLLLLLTFETVALDEIKVRSGQDVTLHCRGPRGVNITLLEWSIPEIKADGYVFFYRNRRSYESYQHERFKGRVELTDPSMKNGDVSVIVKNVSINDTGMYECRIITSDLSSGKRVQNESRESISLTVTDSGFKDNDKKKRGGSNTYLLVIGIAVVVFVSFLVIVAVFVIRKWKSLKHSEHKPVKEVI